MSVFERKKNLTRLFPLFLNISYVTTQTSTTYMLRFNITRNVEGMINLKTDF